MRTAKRLLGFLSLCVLGLTGCPALGPLDGGGYGGLNNDIVGEVQAIDSRNREIVIRTDTGRKMLLRYDNNTQVIYRQRNYAVTNLERGDYVAARVQQDRDGRLSTANITVKEAAQDRGVSRLDQVEGLVENIDSRRGTFEIRDRRDRVIVVAIAFNAPRAVTDRFNRLRNGDYVRIEGRGVSAERFDLENFL
jgi:hypothetical protein